VDASALVDEQGFNPAVLIPVYNHEKAIGLTLGNVLQHKLPVLLVDDGSEPDCRDALTALAEKHSGHVTLLRLRENAGKGAAVKAGMRALFAEGYSHAVQIDADGQHDVTDLPRFLEMGKDNFTALVTGYPKYDESIPKVRYYGRYLTHIWVWINTLSFEIYDAMCGFRVYPLENTVRLINEEKCGDRMDFDPEVIVRWSWRGGKIKNLPTGVSYPSDGVSHFNIWHDNFLISWMHTRLFFGMLWRLPRILWWRLNG